ncbi:MAG: hypothetical protein WCF36_01800 [Candidatus Nanopelagicales bacterium]
MYEYGTMLFMMEAIISPLVTVLITALLAVLVGNRIALGVEIRRRAREYDLAASEEFFRLYGQFFALWKRWNYAVTQDPAAAVVRDQFIKEAADAEGRLEALFVRVTTQRSLLKADVEALGRFRQAYQQLRESIRDGHRLKDWDSSDAPRYVGFKTLASQVALILAPREASRAKGRDSAVDASEALLVSCAIIS